jgi:hypothetical protein
MNKAPLPVRESQEPPFERFLRHCARYWAIAPKCYPRGVFKFHSIEEAQEARQHTHDPLQIRVIRGSAFVTAWT